MKQFCTYGSVRGAISNGRPYSDNRFVVELMQVFVTVEIAICAMRCRRGVIAALKNPGLRRSRLTCSDQDLI